MTALVYRSGEICAPCHGHGRWQTYDDIPKIETCPWCNGSGRIFKELPKHNASTGE